MVGDVHPRLSSHLHTITPVFFLILIVVHVGCLATGSTGGPSGSAADDRVADTSEGAAVVQEPPAVRPAVAAVAQDRSLPEISPAGSANPWADGTRGVLIQHCGKCHLPNLGDSTNTRALAVFDLKEEVWFSRMTDDQLEGLGSRIRGSEAVAGHDKTVVDAFVRCELSGECRVDEG